MARKKGDDGGWIALLAVIVIGGIVYYTQTGQEENDAALIPNDLERDIDGAIAALNAEFGKQWVDQGIWMLRSYLRRLFPQIVALADVVSAVELESRRRSMSPYDKQQAAVRALAG